MGGGSTEFRDNARQCMDLAAQRQYPELRATFLKFAGKWIKLAIRLDEKREPRSVASIKKRSGI
jgi:hypothetical protein